MCDDANVAVMCVMCAIIRQNDPAGSFSNHHHISRANAASCTLDNWDTLTTNCPFNHSLTNPFSSNESITLISIDQYECLFDYSVNFTETCVSCIVDLSAYEENGIR